MNHSEAGPLGKRNTQHQHRGDPPGCGLSKEWPCLSPSSLTAEFRTRVGGGIPGRAACALKLPEDCGHGGFNLAPRDATGDAAAAGVIADTAIAFGLGDLAGLL